MTTSDYQHALAFLMSRIDYERSREMPYRKSTLKLDRMQRLLDLIGNPEHHLPAIHVAGTKGKGSTCAFVSSILHHQGYRVGLFTSPHLQTIEERFRVNGQPCQPPQLVRLTESVRPAVEEIDRSSEFHVAPTYFEICTAMAMLYFAQSYVDFAVLEVGLGGRLDSTNLCKPVVTAITSISFDHMKQLGNTISSIAREKAGIIKPSIPVVSGATHRDASAVIHTIAGQHRSPLSEINRDFQCSLISGEQHLTTFDYRSHRVGSSFRKLDSVQLGLPGQHQIENASVAITICDLLCARNAPVDESALRLGLRQAVCDARIETLSVEPHVVVDAAHNVASVEALIDTIRRWPRHPRSILIFATTEGKDLHGMLSRLAPKFDTIICTRYLNNPRSVDPRIAFDELTKIVRSRNLSTSLLLRETPADAWDAAISSSHRTDFICITGSFFIAAELRHLLHQTVHPV